jgi:hypothetical protein
MERVQVSLTRKQIEAIDFALERTLGSPITTWTKRDIEVVRSALSAIRKAQKEV